MQILANENLLKHVSHRANALSLAMLGQLELRREKGPWGYLPCKYSET